VGGCGGGAVGCGGSSCVHSRARQVRYIPAAAVAALYTDMSAAAAGAAGGMDEAVQELHCGAACGGSSTCGSSSSRHQRVHGRWVVCVGARGGGVGCGGSSCVHSRARQVRYIPAAAAALYTNMSAAAAGAVGGVDEAVQELHCGAACSSSSTWTAAADINVFTAGRVYSWVGGGGWGGGQHTLWCFVGNRGHVRVCSSRPRSALDFGWRCVIRRCVLFPTSPTPLLCCLHYTLL
jgi:type IV secretory pathway VirB2 component (pilin)